MPKNETTIPDGGRKCRVGGCWVVENYAYGGMPPCTQGWAGDAAEQKEHLRGCLLKELQDAK